MPQWLQTLLVARPLAEDANAAGVPYGLVVSLSIVFSVAAALSFIAAASLIGWRKRRSAFATFVVVALLLRAPGFVTEIASLGDRTPEWAGPMLALRALDAICALLFLYVFPTGTFVPRRAALLWSIWAAWVVGTLATPSVNPALNLDQWWAEVTVSLLALTGSPYVRDCGARYARCPRCLPVKRQAARRLRRSPDRAYPEPLWGYRPRAGAGRTPAAPIRDWHPSGCPELG